MADHAAGLGQGRVEVFALSIDRDALPADELMALMAAGSAVGSSTVVDMFESEAFNRALIVALDRRVRQPRVLPIDWSPGLIQRATERITEELGRCPADIAVRLVVFAAAMGLDLPRDVLGRVGGELVGLLVTGRVRAEAFPEPYRPDLLAGLIAQLDVEPLPAAQRAALQRSFTDLRLSAAIAESPLAEHPVAAIQILLDPEANDDDRLALLRGLIPTATEWAVIDRALQALWPTGTMRFTVWVEIVRSFQPPVESQQLPVIADRFIDAAQTIEVLVEIEELLDAAGISVRQLSYKSQDRLEPVALLRQAMLTQGPARGRRVLQAMDKVRSGNDAASRALASRIGEFAIELDDSDVLSLYVKARMDIYDEEGRLVQALNQGLLKAVKDCAELHPERGTEVVARIAPALLQMRQESTLATAARQLVSKWDTVRIAEVTALIGRGLQAQYVRTWQAWASEVLAKHRFMR